MAGLTDEKFAYYNMASFLILDNLILQQVKVDDVLPHLRMYRIIDDATARMIFDGATEGIKRQKILQAVKSHQATGYLTLKMALSAKGHKYRQIMDQIDKIAVPNKDQVERRLRQETQDFMSQQQQPQYAQRPQYSSPQYSSPQSYSTPQYYPAAQSYSSTSYHLEESEDL